MRPYARQTTMLRYRFKDNMGYVFFRNFKTMKEAHLWYEQNKYYYCIKEFGRIGEVIKSGKLYSTFKN